MVISFELSSELFLLSQATENDADKQREKFDSATEVANWLMVKNKDSPQFISNVKARLSNIEKPLTEISHVLSERRKGLETALLSKQNSDSISELYEYRMKDIEKLLRKKLPISVVYEKLKKDDEEEKVILHKLLRHSMPIQPGHVTIKFRIG